MLAVYRSQVVKALRGAIFAGRLQRGENVRETQPARDLQVSQATVRALLELEHAGLVTRIPNLSTTVSSVLRGFVPRPLGVDLRSLFSALKPA